MKGKNTLKLNIDTMHEAVQMWVSSEFSFEPKPKVVAVRMIPANTYPEPGTPAHYEIDIDAAPDAAHSPSTTEKT